LISIKSITVGFSKDKQLYQCLKQILGKYPNNIDLYKTALTQRSDLVVDRTKKHRTNERLEYLGDAVISSIVAEYLYLMFPNKQEGFLTKMRAKIVSRSSLNALSRQSGLVQLIDKQPHSKNQAKGAAGNVFEAIHGAMLLDFGYNQTKKIFVSQFLKFVNIPKLVEEEVDYKSKVLEWSQKHKRKLTFECFEEDLTKPQNRFRAILFDETVKLGEGYGASKKEAEQAAAREALMREDLNIKINLT
jgi:ribonuclease-3